MAQQSPVADDSTRFAVERLANFTQRIQLLNAAVRNALLDFWNETWRRRALDIARSLSTGSPTAGCKETSRLLRSLTALLSLPYGDACAIRAPLEEKLSELLDLLNEQSRKESA